MSGRTTQPSPESSPLFSPARWIEVRTLLESLADASAQTREVELARIAIEDSEMAASLRKLLAEPIERGQIDLLVEQVLPAILNPVPEEMPERIGPFRLIERIGAGGMGTVYLAEREHADFVQRVALKLLDGGSSRLAQLASRERRILAALAHPNITAFVDAGTQDGRAWLAMEYVHGEALIEYCQQRDLAVHDRVRLFDQVCAAVAHAHAQLVVHRDLKPSNVLVDSEGRAKLLDFGIALALDDDQTSAPATRVFTPEYAAPEQLRGERVTTSSDVYSLGLMLYQLVAGKRLPTLGHSARDGEWTTSELARFAVTHDAIATTLVLPQTEAKALSQMLRGDLGRIIAHALNLQPALRYASVASLREDLARWLDDRPLTIGRTETLYVVRRFVRRHRAGVVAALLGLVAVFALAATALWQARAKTQEATTARVALRQSEATRDFMNSVFLSADPYQGKGAQTTAGELLAAARARIDEELAQEPAVAASLLLQIGNVYVSLGDDVAVKETLGKALAYNDRSAQPSAVLEGSAKARLAFATYSAADPEQAEHVIAAAIALLRAAGPDGLAELAQALRIQGNLLYMAGEESAVGATAESVRIFATLDRVHFNEYLISVVALGDMLASLGRYDDALATIDEALARPFTQEHDRATVRGELLGVRARALTGLKRFAEAEPMITQVIDQSASVFGAEHSNTRYWRYNRAQLLRDMGRLDEARAEVERLLTVAASGAEHPMARIAALVTTASIDEQRRARNAATEAATAKAVACGDSGNPTFCARARLLVAEIAIREQRVAAARSALDECSADAAIAKSASNLRRLKLLRARLARGLDELDTARTLLAEAQSGNDPSPDESASFDIEGGFLALATGDRPAGIKSLSRGRAYIAQTLSELTPQVHEIDAALATR